MNALFSIVLQKFDPILKAVGNYPDSIKKLGRTFSMLQAVVNDAEKKQVTNEALQVWLMQLKEVAFDADDLLDEWNTEQQMLKNREKSESGPSNKVRGFISSSMNSHVKPFFTRDSIVHRVAEIQKQLDEIASIKAQFNLKEDQNANNLVTRLETSSLYRPTTVYGREKDKETIVGKLLSEGSSQDSHAFVISIVGTGGFGKTALSQFVYDDKDVVTAFGKRMWVCAPFLDMSNRNKVAKEIIEQAGQEVPRTDGWESLHRSLCDAVRGNKFLLVIDDVWKFDVGVWSQLKLSLDAGSQGSRVLVTTRDENIAERMYSSYIHRLGALSNEGCWELFQYKALQGREDPERFEEIGKALSKKCQGVPLAVMLLSSHLSTKRSEEDWRDVLDSNIWDVTERDGNGVRPEFLLSYYGLSAPMKLCFLYCAIFPQDTIYSKELMVKCWMGEGFIAGNGTDNLEKIGEDYFDGLARLSFFQDFRMESKTLIQCKMHDLVHDFARVLMFGAQNSVSLPQHYSRIDEIPSSFLKMRTLILDCEPDLVIRVLKESKCLRVLSLESCNYLDISPGDVKNLLHLRYLQVTSMEIPELPDSLCDLLNLQTLDLYDCSKLKSLPDRIGELSNLRHLELEGTVELENMPASIGKLGLLRTLSKFVVGDKPNSLKIGALKSLSHLRGSLEILGLEKISDVNEVSQAKLKMKKNLRSVTFDFDLQSRISHERDCEDEDEDEDEDEVLIKKMEWILRDLEPPEGLKKLKIRSYPGHKFPFWISSLFNLVKLSLDTCRGCVLLPCLGNLPFLEDLKLIFFPGVTSLGSEFYGDGTKELFPSLKKLLIFMMPDLIEWEFPDNKKSMPCLSHLTIFHCPKLNVLPYQDVSPALTELQIGYCSAQLLRGAGKLKLLKNLHLEYFTSSECLDEELSEISEETKLESLTIQNMEKWKEWNLPSGVDVFTNLVNLTIVSCNCLVELPALGGLKNLETLYLSHLNRVTHVGSEFLGVSSSSGPTKSFPKLKSLQFKAMDEWKEWVVPFQDKNTEFFPKLAKLECCHCRKLRALPALGRLNSLESLRLAALNEIECLGTEFLGISNNDDEDQEVRSITVFPKLTILDISSMDKWKMEEELMETDQGPSVEIMPCLEELILDSCPMLVAIPDYMFSSSLKKLDIQGCHKLSGRQPSLPSHLQELKLSELSGVFSTSLPVSNSYHKLTVVKLNYLDCTVLPQGFHQFTAIQSLEISGCHHLDFLPEHFRQLRNLRLLEIIGCNLLSKSCVKGENWGSTSRIPEISIDGQRAEVSYDRDNISRKRKDTEQVKRKDKYNKGQ